MLVISAREPKGADYQAVFNHLVAKTPDPDESKTLIAQAAAEQTILLPCSAVIACICVRVRRAGRRTAWVS
jgi:hypothetical protein